MMATALASIFTSSATTAGAVGAAAAPVGAGLLPSAVAAQTAGLSAAAGGGFLESLSTGLFVASGISELAGGFAQQSILEDQATMESFNAQQELVRGREDSLRILQELNDNLAAQMVAAFASGVAPTGSAAAGKEQAIEQAKFETGLARDEAEIRAAARRSEADILQKRGQSALISGATSGLGSIGVGVARSTRR